MRLFLTLLFLPFASFAQEPVHFKIDKLNSSVSFTATQNNAPATGTFTDVDASIYFHPENLKNSMVEAIISTSEIEASYADMVATLTQEDWFSSEKYPDALFIAKNFSKTGENLYQAEGTLKLKGKTHPQMVTFELLRFDPEGAEIKGQASLSRTAFGVGWDETKQVEDEVVIDLHITAVPNALDNVTPE